VSASPARRGASPSLRPTTDDPRVLVAQLRFEVVAEAVAGDGWQRWRQFDGKVFFRCPLCRCDSAELPSAVLADEATWRCGQCEHTGTRYELERLVLESPTALRRMLAIIDARGSS
jgi:hypothetical protein